MTIASTSHLPKEVQESERFDQHSDDGPFAKHEEHAEEEADGPANLLLPCEKVECLLRSDEERNARGEKHVAEC